MLRHPAARPALAATRRPLPARHAFTLAEVIVALGVGGVALGAFALAVGHQERVHAELGRRVRARGQSREGLAALMADLRAVSPAAGDFAVGAALDSSVELRTTIGTAVVCEVSNRSITGALASFVTSPQAGDTAWAYATSDTSASWTPLALLRVATLPGDRPSTCAFPARASNVIGGLPTLRAWYSLEVSEPSAGFPIGTPLRITRPVRYSLYRSPDSRWYLGRREWSPAQGRFETIQPVSGPYRPYASEANQTSGLELRYVDRDATQVPSGSLASDRIAQVTVVLRSPSPPGEGQARDRRDVTAVTVALRNSP
jgi:hypothetical protein